MVLDYYKLREEPFGVTPDSRFLYASATHREALASLLYGVEAGRGFVSLIAKPGMGKTTLLFHALNQLQDKARTVFLFQTVCTPVGFLRALLAELGVQAKRGTLLELQSKLNEVVVEQSRLGKPLVIVIDEAQNLDRSVLELVRMLSNFETSREKLIHIILSGQPQLAEKLASPELVQLRQRVSILAELEPFSAAETALYIGHRLRTAGYNSDAPLFTKGALALIAQSSEGIPRNINNLCFNALSLGCALKRGTIDCDIVREVIADLDLAPLWAAPAAEPEKGGAQEAPAFLSAARAMSMLWSRLPKLALTRAALILFAFTLPILGGALLRNRLFGSRILQSHRQEAPVAAPVATVRENSVIPPLVALEPSLYRRFGRGPQPGNLSGTVRVASGQTLYRICVDNFGSCNLERLQEIHRLNPWLSDLDHIESGERIRIPGAGQASLTERGMQ